jgi:hypothetical protein
MSALLCYVYISITRLSPHYNCVTSFYLTTPLVVRLVYRNYKDVMKK